MPSQAEVLMLDAEKQVGFYPVDVSLLGLHIDSKFWIHMWLQLHHVHFSCPIM